VVCRLQGQVHAGRYCYPLTITDFASRYLIACEALQSTREAYAFTVFENAFREFGLPNAVRGIFGPDQSGADCLLFRPVSNPCRQCSLEGCSVKRELTQP